MTWVLAISVTLIAVLAEARSSANEPLVAVFVFAGFLATRLPMGKFLGLVLVIAATLLAPLSFDARGNEQLWRRMIGLSCLAGMTIYQCNASQRAIEEPELLF